MGMIIVGVIVLLSLIHLMNCKDWVCSRDGVEGWNRLRVHRQQHFIFRKDAFFETVYKRCAGNHVYGERLDDSHSRTYENISKAHM